MNKFWFKLHPDTFIWCNSNKGILYNSNTKSCYSFFINEKLKSIIYQLQILDNLYCIELTDKDVLNQLLEPFLRKATEHNFGLLLNKSDYPDKPISLQPILKLQGDIIKLSKDPFVQLNINFKQYLHEISIHLDSWKGSLFHNLEIKINDDERIDFVRLLRFVKDLKGSSLNTINIYCSDFLQFPELSGLVSEIRQPCILIYHTPLSKISIETLDLLYKVSDSSRLKIHVSSIFVFDIFKEIALTCINSNIRIEWLFNCSSENEFDGINKVIDKFNLKDTEIQPIFKNNIDFFERYIYLNEEDIMRSSLSKREIFAHQTLNTNDFGKLIILADGNVFANLYHNSLSTINESVNAIVYKEMNKGNSWLRIRNLEPCKNCVYQWLCPSPSHYELAIGKPNLCHISC